MKPKLLIAEGDAELCSFYQKFITQRGYEVETATDGLDCLAKLRQFQPRVLVLDLELRWGGGAGVLAWLREERSASRVPVILTATAGYPQDAANEIEPPVIQFLSKPFALTSLLLSVRAAVANNEHASLVDRDGAFARSERFSSDKKEESSVAKAAALLILPSMTRAGNEANAVHAAPLMAQSLEDLHLAERVERTLHATGQGALRSVEITTQERLVILSGRVPSYYLKQVARTIALAVPGVQRVRNDLSVDRPL